VTEGQHSLITVDRLIGREQVIEGAVLANDDDDVFDRRRRIVVIGVALSGSVGDRRKGIDCHCTDRDTT